MYTSNPGGVNWNWVGWVRANGGGKIMAGDE